MSSLKISRGFWSNSTAGRILASHESYPAQISGIPYGLQSLPRQIFEFRARTTPDHCQVYPQNNKIIKKINIEDKYNKYGPETFFYQVHHSIPLFYICVQYI